MGALLVELWVGKRAGVTVDLTDDLKVGEKVVKKVA